MYMYQVIHDRFVIPAQSTYHGHSMAIWIHITTTSSLISL